MSVDGEAAANDSEAAFAAFLAEVDSLAISDDVSRCAASDSDGLASPIAAPPEISHSREAPAADESGLGGGRPSACDRKNHRNQLIARADEGRSAWKDFTLGDVDGSTPTAPAEKETREPLSFTIGKTKKKKKAKTRLRAPAQNESAPPPFISPLPPIWTAVVDTCCFLEEEVAVERIVTAAHAAALVPKGSTATTVEPIKLVISYKVWDELDYRSKVDETSRRARSAIRMLKYELERSQQAGIDGCVVVRSQSRAELDAAAAKFLSIGSATATNDDHILACAQAECARNDDSYNDAALALHPAVEAGGVVLLTTDNNLTCKAHANGVKVFSAESFHDYYQRRLESLRARGNRNIL